MKQLIARYRDIRDQFFTLKTQQDYKCIYPELCQLMIAVEAKKGTLPLQVKEINSLLNAVLDLKIASQELQRSELYLEKYELMKRDSRFVSFLALKMPIGAVITEEIAGDDVKNGYMAVIAKNLDKINKLSKLIGSCPDRTQELRDAYMHRFMLEDVDALLNGKTAPIEPVAEPKKEVKKAVTYTTTCEFTADVQTLKEMKNWIDAHRVQFKTIKSVLNK